LGGRLFTVGAGPTGWPAGPRTGRWKVGGCWLAGFVGSAIVTGGLPGRSVTLLLCTEDVVLGSLAPFPVSTPYWQGVDEVVAACRGIHGVQVVVLRLLQVAMPNPHDGGPVTYLAEVDRPPAARLLRWTGADPLADHPRRASYAQAGGTAGRPGVGGLGAGGPGSAPGRGAGAGTDLEPVEHLACPDQPRTCLVEGSPTVLRP